MMTMPLTASVIRPRDTAGSRADDEANGGPGLSFDAVLTRHVGEPGNRTERRASATVGDSRSDRGAATDGRSSDAAADRVAADRVTARRTTSDRHDTGRGAGTERTTVDPPTDDAAAQRLADDADTDDAAAQRLADDADTDDAAAQRLADDADTDDAAGDVGRDADRGTGAGVPRADAQPAGVLTTSADRSTASAAAPLGQAPASPPEAPAPTVPADHQSVAVVTNITTATDLATTGADVVPTSAAPTTPAPDAVPPGASTHMPADPEVPREPTITGVTVEVLTSSRAAAEPAGYRATAPTAAPGAPAPDMPPMAGSAPAHAASGITSDIATASPPTVDAPDQPVVPTSATTTASTPAGTPAPATAAPPAPTDAASAATAAATAGATAPAGPRAASHHAPAEPTAQPGAPLTSDRAAASTSSPHPAPASGATATTADGQHVAATRLPDAVDQVQRELQIRRAEQITRLGVDVATDGLGAIRVEATNAGGGLQLQLGADRAATRQLLTDHAVALRDELGAGTTVSVDIGHARTGSDGRTPASHARPAPTTTSPDRRPRSDLATATAVAPSIPRTGHDGRGVDVRL